MHDAWLERWEIGRTGWHEAGGNRGLRRHWRASGRRVLVPLCGKSADLLWLERCGNSVTGVELSPIAARAFFDDNELRYDVERGTLDRYAATDRDITIWCGDYLSFDGGRFDALYDRGALVAVEPAARAGYVRHTRALLEDDPEILLVTVEYDSTVCEGPPYPVGADAVLGYWPQLERVEACDDTDNAPPKFLDAGLTRFDEVIWRTR